jgi:hypothetical protein
MACGMGGYVAAYTRATNSSNRSCVDGDKTSSLPLETSIGDKENAYSSQHTQTSHDGSLSTSAHVESLMNLHRSL